MVKITFVVSEIPFSVAGISFKIILKEAVMTSVVAKIISVVGEITFSSSAKITFVVTDIFSSFVDIRLLVARINFVMAQIFFKEVVSTSSVAKITFVVISFFHLLTSVSY